MRDIANINHIFFFALDVFMIIFNIHDSELLFLSLINFQFTHFYYFNCVLETFLVEVSST